MDADLQTSGKRRRGTLTKNPPPSAFPGLPSLRKPQSSNSLQRAPSAPYPRSQAVSQSARDTHQRTKSSAYGSSTSLEQISGGPSPVVGSVDFFPTTANGHQLPAHLLPLTLHSSDDRTNDLIGPPFDSAGLISSLQATAANGTLNAAGSKPPLYQAHTSPDLRLHPPPRSQTSASSGSGPMEATPLKVDNGPVSPKRFSGEAQLVKPTGPFRKKSGFSSFVNSMLGSPRTIKISAPENPMHMIHVGYDNETGKFTVGWVWPVHRSRD